MYRSIAPTPGSRIPRLALALLALFAVGLAGCSGETPTSPAPVLTGSGAGAASVLIDDELGAVGGVVFDDANQNGVRDEGEAGLEGLTVTLGLPTGGTLPATTGPDGTYLFDDLQPGFYVVTAPEPEGWTLTTPANVQVRVVAAELATVDHGLYSEAVPGEGSISGTVFLDVNQNGMMDEGDEGMAGVEVRMTGPNGLTGQSTTGVDGRYEFPVPEDGEYSVFVPEIEDYAFTTADSVTQLLTVDDDVTVDFGLIRLVVASGSIRGTAYEDTNRNGLLDPGEAGLPGVEVRMTGPGGLDETMLTAADGTYGFAAPEDGEYTVSVGEVEGYSFTTDSVVTRTLVVPGQVTIDFGLAMELPPVDGARIGGMVYEDLDGDGMRDAGEPGLAGVQVRLSSRNEPRNGDTLPGFGIHRYAITDADGHYEFEGVDAGQWRVFPKKPHGYHRSSAKDSVVSVADGDVVDDTDFGFVARR